MQGKGGDWGPRGMVNRKFPVRIGEGKLFIYYKNALHKYHCDSQQAKQNTEDLQHMNEILY